MLLTMGGETAFNGSGYEQWFWNHIYRIPQEQWREYLNVDSRTDVPPFSLLIMHAL